MAATSKWSISSVREPILIKKKKKNTNKAYVFIGFKQELKREVACRLISEHNVTYFQLNKGEWSGISTRLFVENPENL